MIEFDYTNVRQKITGIENGIDVDFEFANYSEKISQIIKNISSLKNSSLKYDWINFVDNKSLLSKIYTYSDMVRGKFENLIIAGSSYSLSGIKAVVEALLSSNWNNFDNKERNNFPTVDFVSSIDPDKIRELTNTRNLKKSLIITICLEEPSPEIMSAFMLAKKRMEYELGENYRMHMVTCTGSTLNILNQLANQEGLTSFNFSDNIFGSFSIFSSCGILPLVLLGIDVNEFLKGAKIAFENIQNSNINENKAAQMALIRYLIYSQKNRKYPVIMSYSQKLNSLTQWCCQIEADTIRKNYDKNGNIINSEKIPQYTLCCNNHHKLFQIIDNGMHNNFINIFNVQNYESDNVIPQIFDYTSAGYLGGKSLSELIEAEINAIKMTLVDYKHPNTTINIPKITPFYLGQFMALYMGAMVIQAYLYNIDPFAKSDSDMLLNYIYAQMGRHGYETTYKEMQNKFNKIAMT